MHAGDDDVETVEQAVLLVERAVLVDVDLYAGEDAKGCRPEVEPPHLLELLAQPFPGEASGHGKSRRVVGEGDILVTQRARRLGHLQDAAAAVRPVRVRVAVASKRRTQRRGVVGHGAAFGGFQPTQVDRGLAALRFDDRQRRDGADAGQLLERTLTDPPFELVRGEC